MESLSYKELVKLAKVYPPLTPEEQEYLAVRAAQGDKAAEEKLILHNIRRLLYFVEVFTPGGPGRRHIPEDDARLRAINRWREFAPRSITPDDILSAAQFALLKAVRTYRPMPGTRMTFNRYANILIFREIQHMREKHERMPQPPYHDYTRSDGRPPKEPPLDAELPPEPPSPGEERAMAMVLFEHYAEKILSPEERARLRRILAGEEEADEGFLKAIGRKLQQAVPAEDWAFMASLLTGRD